MNRNSDIGNFLSVIDSSNRKHLLTLSASAIKVNTLSSFGQSAVVAPEQK
ncbi:MAG: hypothetical protein OEV42_09110 [Deltaproteobacteria bacterium]|nr:hypothetical protein [Deltaproteobacteria bacterium]